MILAYGLSDAGCVRKENEDRILVDLDLKLFIVADGMGGHSYGEVAAELGVATVQSYIVSSRGRPDVTWPFGYDINRSLSENRLATAIQLASRQVWKHSEQAPECAGMGTTIVAVLVDGDGATIASAGDSRAYLFRDGELKPLTVDDTWVATMIRQGVLDPEDAIGHPMANILTQAAGVLGRIEVHTVEVPLVPGDLLLLCTDGLHGVAGDEAIRSILQSGEGLERSAARLVQTARSNGAPDNVSCILVQHNPEANSSE